MLLEAFTRDSLEVFFDVTSEMLGEPGTDEEYAYDPNQDPDRSKKMMMTPARARAILDPFSREVLETFNHVIPGILSNPDFDAAGDWDD
ncbi:hypothetical protein [Neorhodopirellula pilleata]|uniref:Uncharacterized protein n=1 Tax=Neorhodopirellula pilleata TaxID=2714738 RepID=A0A5C6ABR5_9BACT|nr:hypothetical protein [Neorhodopirellula pilleata]TWT95773.1 hypothetical protein Pla100_34150 [Neorhodopirellula pilleata]